MVFDIIVATSLPDNEGKLAIGKHGGIPWHCPEDLKHFKLTTSTTRDEKMRNAVIMGRKTWDSLVALKVAPLTNRLNVVVTRQAPQSSSHSPIWATSFDDALNVVSQQNDIENIFVIGGGQLYDVAIRHPDVSSVIQTIVHIECPEADTLFPDPSKFGFRKYHESNTSTTSTPFHIEYWKK